MIDKYSNLINKLQKNQDMIEVKLIMDELSSKVESSYLFDLIEKIKNNNNNILSEKNDLKEKNDEN